MEYKDYDLITGIPKIVAREVKAYLQLMPQLPPVLFNNRTEESGSFQVAPDVNKISNNPFNGFNGDDFSFPVKLLFINRNDGTNLSFGKKVVFMQLPSIHETASIHHQRSTSIYV